MRIVCRHDKWLPWNLESWISWGGNGNVCTSLHYCSKLPQTCTEISIIWVWGIVRARNKLRTKIKHLVWNQEKQHSFMLLCNGDTTIIGGGDLSLESVTWSLSRHWTLSVWAPLGRDQPVENHCTLCYCTCGCVSGVSTWKAFVSGHFACVATVYSLRTNMWKMTKYKEAGSKIFQH